MGLPKMGAVNFLSQGLAKQAVRRVPMMLGVGLPLSLFLAPCLGCRNNVGALLTWLSCQTLLSWQLNPKPGLRSSRAAAEGLERAARTAAALIPRRKIRRRTLLWLVKRGR